MDYIAFDMAYVKQMFFTIYTNAGNIFGIFFYIFLAVLAVFLVAEIVEKFTA